MYDMVASLLDELRQGKAACMPKIYVCMGQGGGVYHPLNTVASVEVRPRKNVTFLFFRLCSGYIFQPPFICL